jgi:C4-dicarboxylate-specific signal transduction histidine kinase
LRKQFEFTSVVSEELVLAIEVFGFLSAALVAYATIKRFTDNLEFMVSENLKKTRLLRFRQESLTLRTEELDATLEALPDACLRISSEGVVRAINGSVRSVWKRSLRDKSLNNIVGDSTAKEILSACEIAGETGKVQMHAFRFRTHGLELCFEARVSAVGLGDFIINVRDETARNKQTELLRQQDVKIFQSSKMATLGEMAGNIAHEINNPLSVILGIAEIMEGRLEDAETPQPELLKYLSKIVNTSQRIAKIVLGLKHFARDGNKEPLGPIDINHVVDETLTLCENSLKTKGVKFINRLGNVSGIFVKGRSIQLSQVFLNLIGNAADAISELDIRTIELSAELKDEAIVFSIADSGSGILPEVREKLFNPFFTTKEVGKGTGLGLSISKGIVESMGGTLTYDSARSNTTFCVTLLRHVQDTPQADVA